MSKSLVRTDNARINRVQFTARIADEVSRAHQSCRHLEHAVERLLAEIEGADIAVPQDLQSLDKLTQTLDCLHLVLSRMGGSESDTDEGMIEDYVAPVYLKDVADRLSGRDEPASVDDNGDIDIF